jgi:hypothetical protein
MHKIMQENIEQTTRQVNNTWKKMTLRKIIEIQRNC